MGWGFLIHIDFISVSFCISPVFHPTKWVLTFLPEESKRAAEQCSSNIYIAFRTQPCAQHVKLISCGKKWWYDNSFSVNVFADPVDVIDVDWSSLMPKQPKEPREPGAALLKFTPGAVMLRVGISKRLAGPELFTKIKETCQRVLEKPKGNFCRD